MKDTLTLGKIDALGGGSFLAFGKILLFAFHASLFLLSHALFFVLIRNEKRRLRLIVRSNAFHARIVCAYLGIEAFHEESSERIRGKLVICNHLSYVDVLVLFTRYPALFITSREIERTPFLGQITKLAGCFFVERRKERRTPDEAERELALMRRRLGEGFNIFLFPEGTSSDGRAVLPFKAHFFQLAVETGCSIQPVHLRYLGDNRHVPPWYGDMSFLPHFLEVCRQKEISVNVRRLEKISPRGKDRFSLKDEAENSIRSAHEHR